MTYSPIAQNHFTFDVLPSSKRIFGVATFAAACAARLSNHSLYGIDPSGRMYSSTRIFITYGNVYVTVPQALYGFPIGRLLAALLYPFSANKNRAGPVARENAWNAQILTQILLVIVGAKEFLNKDST